MKVIVTLTSWIKRINNLQPTLDGILNGERVPDKIILNLSIEEFNEAGISLPDYLEELKWNNDRFSVNWVKGPNTKTFKKLLPTLEQYPDDIVISIDDDIIYPPNFVKELVDAFEKDPTHPITIHYFYYKGALLPWGGGTLYKKEFLKGYEEFLDDEIIKTYEDDWFYGYLMVYNGVELKLAPDEICYTPERYWQSTYDDQMFKDHTYSSMITRKILDSKLEGRGVTFDSLVNKLFEK